MLNRFGTTNARTVTLSLTAALLVVFVALLVIKPVPYARLSPGPATDTLGEANGRPLIQISGVQTYPDSGKLDLTTVAISSPSYDMRLIEAIWGWLRPGVAIVPRSSVYPDDLSAEDIEVRNTQEMALSQKHATAAALRELDIAMKAHTVVAALTEGTPAAASLQIADRILKIDGTDVAGPADVVDLVRVHKPGEKVRFTIERDGQRRTETVTTVANPADASLPFVGLTPDLDYEFPFDVQISLDDVGGPSAGLMFALGIVERLTEADLTGGRHIAGTGSISDDGVVGKIGGIQMKILGAQRSGATVFMVPAGNCREAAADPPDGITLVRVDTLATAVDALTALNTGEGTVPTCA